nr:recombinase family protein [Acetobacter thailandicus]
MTYRTGVAGVPSAAVFMADHLLEQTVPASQAALARYYNQPPSAENIDVSTAEIGNDIDPIQAETVRLIFGLYRDGDGQSGGLGIKVIVSHLNAKGYRTQTGSRFSCKFIHDVLTRETYASTHAFNVVEAKTGRKKASDEVITMDAPVIIPRSEFLEVQQRLK